MCLFSADKNENSSTYPVKISVGQFERHTERKTTKTQTTFQKQTPSQKIQNQKKIFLFLAIAQYSSFVTVHLGHHFIFFSKKARCGIFEAVVSVIDFSLNFQM